ncbi:hypothetical protein [Arcobacter sp.]|uniref:hypothetical protein n=1 Tax=Arcobacter sp. TaxID=1872629 RepID=UPI003D136CA7
MEDIRCSKCNKKSNNSEKLSDSVFIMKITDDLFYCDKCENTFKKIFIIIIKENKKKWNCPELFLHKIISKLNDIDVSLEKIIKEIKEECNTSYIILLQRLRESIFNTDSELYTLDDIFNNVNRYN